MTPPLPTYNNASLVPAPDTPVFTWTDLTRLPASPATPARWGVATVLRQVMGKSPTQEMWIAGGFSTPNISNATDTGLIDVRKLDLNFTDLACRDGSYNKGGVGDCVPCPSGFYMNVTAASQVLNPQYPNIIPPSPSHLGHAGCRLYAPDPNPRAASVWVLNPGSRTANPQLSAASPPTPSIPNSQPRILNPKTCTHFFPSDSLRWTHPPHPPRLLQGLPRQRQLPRLVRRARLLPLHPGVYELQRWPMLPVPRWLLQVYSRRVGVPAVHRGDQPVERGGHLVLLQPGAPAERDRGSHLERYAHTML